MQDEELAGGVTLVPCPCGGHADPWLFEYRDRAGNVIWSKRLTPEHVAAIECWLLAFARSHPWRLWRHVPDKELEAADLTRNDLRMILAVERRDVNEHANRWGCPPRIVLVMLTTGDGSNSRTRAKYVTPVYEEPPSYSTNIGHDWSAARSYGTNRDVHRPRQGRQRASRRPQRRTTAVASRDGPSSSSDDPDPSDLAAQDGRSCG